MFAAGGFAERECCERHERRGERADRAERYAGEIPETRLVGIKSAGHINDHRTVAGTLAEFFAAEH
jgi:hypothetical protein